MQIDYFSGYFAKIFVPHLHRGKESEASYYGKKKRRKAFVTWEKSVPGIVICARRKTRELFHRRFGQISDSQDDVHGKRRKFFTVWYPSFSHL